MEAYRRSQNFEEASTSSSTTSSIIGEEVWQHAETLAMQILRQIEPTEASERNRKEIVKYMQDILTPKLGCAVISYGSFPLKAYLPHGDIDMTILKNQSNDEELAKKVLEILNNEEHNKDAKYEVKDIHFINAEVKIIKCRVHDLMIDLSFNQISGLRALCFFYMVDSLIGRDHLFKKTIILIKAWCYYESRLLGGNHGLVSTYGLEILITHIFNIYHKSIEGPLQALYLFLNYFSKFDWNKYCVSVLGLVELSSMSDTTLHVETPQQSGVEALLSEEFMKDCFHVLALNSMDQERTSSVFPLKHFNIIDPLRKYNNLGRSVSKGNLFRISCAFSYGAKKLDEILRQSPSLKARQLNKYFTNTLKRCGHRERPDVMSALGGDPMGAEVTHNKIESVSWALETMLAISEAEAGEASSLVMGDQFTRKAGDHIGRLETDSRRMRITEEEARRLIEHLRVIIGSESSSAGTNKVMKKFHEYYHDLMVSHRNTQQFAPATSRVGEEAEAFLKAGSSIEVDDTHEMEPNADDSSANVQLEFTGVESSTSVATMSQRSTPIMRNAEVQRHRFELSDDEFPPLSRR